MTKTLYKTLYKAAVDNLSQWIKDFNEQVARYNEQVAAFDKSIPTNLESRRLLERDYNRLIAEWQKLIRKVQEAEKTFGVKGLLGMIETQPTLPNRPDKPDYMVHRLLANLGSSDPSIYKPQGQFRGVPSLKPFIPPGAKLDQPSPFIQVAPPVAPGYFPERLQATLAAAEMPPKAPAMPKEPTVPAEQAPPKNPQLEKWIERFNRQAAKYNELVQAFNSMQARTLEEWETRLGNHTWLINKWNELHKKLQEAAERFGPQVRHFKDKIIMPQGPRLPDPPPGYTFEQALAISSKKFPDPYHTDSPIPFRVKMRSQQPPMQKALGYIKSYWRPAAYGAGAAVAGTSLAALLALLAKKFLDKQQGSTDQMPENREPPTAEPIEKTSACISIPPAVPYILG